MHQTTFSIIARDENQRAEEKLIQMPLRHEHFFFSAKEEEKNRQNCVKKKTSNCFAISQKRNPPLPNESFAHFDSFSGRRRTLKEINWDQFSIRGRDEPPPLEIHESVIFPNTFNWSISL